MNQGDPAAKNSLPQRRRVELVAVMLFVAVNLAAPLLVGEMYPFTVSPMFRDQPCQYCTYQLFNEDGIELDAESFGLHLVYDGNPPGLGMGIEATPTMHAFGEVPQLADVEAHVRDAAQRNGFVTGSIRVVQAVVQCVDCQPRESVRETVIHLDSRGDLE